MRTERAQTTRERHSFGQRQALQASNVTQRHPKATPPQTTQRKGN
jgi:hypothetical protein